MERTTYIKLILLNKNERPLEEISGRTTQGSIQINGQSSMRRTCNITLIPDTIDFNKYLWVLNNKFKVEVGVSDDGGEIIWYNQGIYAITTFSASLGVGNYSVSIQGQDKMAFLNGTIGGHISASLDAGREEVEQPNGVIAYRDRPIKEIIRDVVHKFGGEPYYNILINDLDDKGKILQAYAYNKDLFLGRKATETFYKYAFWGDRKFSIKIGGEKQSLEDLLKNDAIVFDYLDPIKQGTEPTTFYYGEDAYHIAHFTYGETIGYKNTELTYAGELISNPGDTVTSILDKLTQMLGEFEYFYNLDGQFVFQRKKVYAKTPFSPYDKSLGWVDLNAQKIAYTFPNLLQVSSFNDTYGLNNVKNDFSIWGERTSISGAKLPIHMRYAIDKKPFYYKSITVTDEELEHYNKEHGFNLKGQIGRIYKSSEEQGYIDDMADVCNKAFYLEEETLSTDERTHMSSETLLKLSPVFHLNSETMVLSLHQTQVLCDWREIIYQMARDYTRYNHLDNFQQKIIEANQDMLLYTNGTTGYEQYYLDIEAYWRELYNPWAYVRNISISDDISFNAERALDTIYYRGDNGKIFIPVGLTDKYDSSKSYYSRDTSFYTSDSTNFPWKKDIFYAPHNLNFWFDFLDTQGAMSKYSVSAIGSRTIVDSKSKPMAIHYEQVPDLLFLDTVDRTAVSDDLNTPYVEFYLGDYSNLLVSSPQGASAKEVLDTLLFEHTLATETVAMQALPIYNLEPNTLIQIDANEANIHGEFIVNSITLPLSYNGMMSINALKCSVFEDSDTAAILGQAILGLMILGND